MPCTYSNFSKVSSFATYMPNAKSAFQLLPYVMWCDVMWEVERGWEQSQGQIQQPWLQKELVTAA